MEVSWCGMSGRHAQNGVDQQAYGVALLLKQWEIVQTFCNSYVVKEMNKRADVTSFTGVLVCSILIVDKKDNCSN